MGQTSRPHMPTLSSKSIVNRSLCEVTGESLHNLGDRFDSLWFPHLPRDLFHLTVYFIPWSFICEALVKELGKRGVGSSAIHGQFNRDHSRFTVNILSS